MKFILSSLFVFIFSFICTGQEGGLQNIEPTPKTEPVAAASPENLIAAKKNDNPLPKASRVYASKTSPAGITRFEVPPTIDGKLDDEIWNTATVFGDFLQTNPGDNIAPKYPTEVMIGYDSKNLYIAFRAKQERSTVRATVARRDQIFNDEYVGVFLDTFNDQRQSYIFFFNPLGIQGDGVFTEGRGEDYNVDLVLESKGVLTDDGYTVEAAIPFKSLRYEAGKNKQWGIHIYRRVQHNNRELDSWMPNNRNITGSLNQAGHITGLEGISTTRQLEINPSVTFSQTGRRTRYTFDGDPNGRYVNGGLKGELGLTAKFSLTPTTTLDFAYNPDFAQVEADAPVNTANQRFPIFFAERRPFFLERIDIFNTRMNVVNTRAIVDPDVAVKLTGRRGKNTFGILYASDNAPGNYSLDEREGLRECQNKRILVPGTICNTERFVDKNADIGVVRLKRDVGRQHSVGFFATTYNFTERHNNTAGFDGRFLLTPKIVAEFQLVGTNSRRFFYNPDLDKSIYRTGNGFGYSYSIQRNDRNLTMQFNGVGRTRDYRADVGFTTRVDNNQHRTFVQYQTERDASKKIIFKRIFNETYISHDFRGRTQNWASNTQGMLALQRQTFVGLGNESGYERVFESEFGANRSATRPGTFFGSDPERSAHKNETYGFIETTPNKQLFAFFLLSYTKGQLDYDLGNGYDYPRVSRAALLNPNNALDPGPGDQFYIESTVRYQPTTALQAQLNYNKVRLIREDTGKVAFDDNIYSFRSTYQFNRDIFARLRLDYSTISTRIRPQLVVGWNPSPGTAIYAGYNDDVSYNGYNQYTGLYEPGFRGNGRTFFIKASYLFRKSF
jgi:Carbohydrate family 9 binding domain-like